MEALRPTILNRYEVFFSYVPYCHSSFCVFYVSSMYFPIVQSYSAVSSLIECKSLTAVQWREEVV